MSFGPSESLHGSTFSGTCRTQGLRCCAGFRHKGISSSFGSHGSRCERRKLGSLVGFSHIRYAHPARDHSALLTSIQAADQFVKDYYEATNAHRHNLASYYLSSTAIAGSESPISIVFNGIEVPDGKAAQEIFEKSVPRSQIEVDTIDCQILNPNHSPAANASQHPKSAAKSCSILVIVGGIFKASDDRNEEEEDFNDSLIIVPNPEPPPPRPTRGPRYKDYLIQTQNFRLVSGDALDNDGIKMTE